MNNKIKIIIDTDLGADCDDVGAIALAIEFAKRNECEILAVSHCIKGEEGPKCIDIISTYYDLYFPIGVNDFKYIKDNNVHSYDREMIKQYEKYIKNSKYENSVNLYRKILSEADDDSVVFITIGTLTNVSALICSKKDNHSSLSGKELLHKKVKKFVCMFGIFNDGSRVTNFNNNERFVEYNVQCDVEAARNFVSNVKKPVYIVDFYDGVDVWTCKKLFDKNIISPITLSYELYAKGPSRSWDLLAVYYVIKNEFYDEIGPGFLKIDDVGYSSFLPDEKGNFFYLRPNVEKEKIEDTIDEFLISLEERSYASKRDN